MAGTNDEAGKADLIVLGTAYEQAWLDTFKFRITYVKDPQILRGSSSAVLSEISVSQFRREHQSASQCAEILQMYWHLTPRKKGGPLLRGKGS